MPKMTRNKLRRVFSALGAAEPETDDIPGLDDHVISQIIGMSAESKGYRMLEPAEPTDRLRRLVADYARSVRRLLQRWGERHEAWFASGSDGDELYFDDGAYAALMTLRGEGLGILDGRWDHHFRPENAEQAARNLKVAMTDGLKRWANRDCNGVLCQAFSAEAERQGRAQNPEQQDDVEEDADEDEEIEIELDDSEEESEDDEESDSDDSEDDAPVGQSPRAQRRQVPAAYIAPPRPAGRFRR